MTYLEERIRAGLHETAERIPESGTALEEGRSRWGWPVGVWMGVAAVLAVLVLFSPLLFLTGSDRGASSGDGASPPSGEVNEALVPADVGFEFAQPEHVHLRFSQELTLVCQDMDTIDNGGFDSFDVDIWIDHASGYARLGFDYPDGSAYDLILQGEPGHWETAWGSGTDLGRSAGCRETQDDGGYTQSIAGWAFQDASPLWFTEYLKPVTPGDDFVVISHERRPTEAKSIGGRAYVVDESNSALGTRIRFEYTVDEAGIRVMGDQREVHVPGQFDASATVEVSESGPAPMPEDIFDTSTFTPLWSTERVVTTAADS
jgi:hypothetical protein